MPLTWERHKYYLKSGQWTICSGPTYQLYGGQGEHKGYPKLHGCNPSADVAKARAQAMQDELDKLPAPDELRGKPLRRDQMSILEEA